MIFNRGFAGGTFNWSMMKGSRSRTFLNGQEVSCLIFRNNEIFERILEMAVRLRIPVELVEDSARRFIRAARDAWRKNPKLGQDASRDVDTESSDFDDEELQANLTPAMCRYSYWGKQYS